MIVFVYTDPCKILQFSLSTHAFKSILKYPVMFNFNMKRGEELEIYIQLCNFAEYLLLFIFSLML